MEHWIGYYAAFFAAFSFGIGVGAMDADDMNRNIALAIFILAPYPLILHAWGVL